MEKEHEELREGKDKTAQSRKQKRTDSRTEGQDKDSNGTMYRTDNKRPRTIAPINRADERALLQKALQ